MPQKLRKQLKRFLAFRVQYSTSLSNHERLRCRASKLGDRGRTQSLWQFLHQFWHSFDAPYASFRNKCALNRVCFVICFQNLIQYSHLKSAQHKEQSIKSPKATIIFCVAWLIFVGGNLLNFISFSYAAQTVLSSLGSVQFIANILFIYLLFRIKPTKMQIIGTVFIISGNICIVTVANKSTHKFDSSQLISLFVRSQYISYLVSILCLSGIFQLLFLYLQSLNKSSLSCLDEECIPQNSPVEQPECPTKRGSPFNEKLSRKSSLTFLIPADIPDNKMNAFLKSKSSLLIPTCYALISAMIGSQSVVLAKSSSFVIVESIESDSQFDDAPTYLFIGSWAVAMTFWLYRMNNALRLYEGVFIIPVLQVLWMLFRLGFDFLFETSLNLQHF